MVKVGCYESCEIDPEGLHFPQLQLRLLQKHATAHLAWPSVTGDAHVLLTVQAICARSSSLAGRALKTPRLYWMPPTQSTALTRHASIHVELIMIRPDQAEDLL